MAILTWENSFPFWVSSLKLKCEDNAAHNCHKIIRTCPTFHSYIHRFQPSIAAVDNLSITLLIHTCVHPHLMGYVNARTLITGHKDAAVPLFLVTIYKVRNKTKQSSTCRIYPSIKCDFTFCRYVGRDSAVGKATRYGLDGPGIKSWWGGGIFRTHPDRPWGPPSLIYRVIHKSLREFRTRLRNNQDRHGRKEHINR